MPGEVDGPEVKAKDYTGLPRPMYSQTNHHNECEHTVVVALAFKSYGTRDNVERAIEELHRWVQVEKQQEVDIVAFGYTDNGSLVTKNGTVTIQELVDEADG